MKFAQLEALLKVVETGSFSNAALELDQAQSAVSYNVGELELELGIKLLERGRFGAKENDSSKDIIPHIRAIQQHMAAIEQISSSHKKGKKGIVGSLKIATFRSAAGRILPPILSSLRKKHPKLRFEFVDFATADNSLGNSEQMLKQHIADIAFIEYDIPLQDSSDLITWEVLKDEYQVITVKDDSRKSLTWEEIAQEDLIMDMHDECAIRVHAHFESLGLSNTPLYRVPQDSTILRMASEGLGIGILPKLAIDELPKTAKIIPTATVLERGIGVSILPSMLKVPAVRAFLSCLKAMYPDSAIPALDL